MSLQNIEGYKSIAWILDYSAEGIFLLIASEKAQAEVVERYRASNAAVLDCKVGMGAYSFEALENFVEGNVEAEAFFLLNFHLAVQSDGDIARLNFSRDMITRLQKNMFFCVTQTIDDRLAKTAHDFYSYVKLRVFFQEEFELFDEKEFAAPSIDLNSQEDEVESVDFSQDPKELFTYTTSLLEKAEQFCDEHRYEKALEYYKKVLEIYERVLGIEHPNTATTHNSIAALHGSMGEYEKAFEYYKKALEILEKVLGAEHPDTATTYNDIANLNRAIGEYEKAFEYYKKALEISEKVLGAEHPFTAAIYSNIADLHKAIGEHEKAFEYFKKVLEILEKVHGIEHPNTASTYNNIAGLHKAIGEHEKAFEYYEKALEISEKVLGIEHPNTKHVHEAMKMIKEQL